jgi:hypothetical protein
MSRRRRVDIFGAIPAGGKPPVDVAPDKPSPGGWVEVAPGLSYGVRSFPSRWHRFWLRVLCGWTFRRTREPIQ